MLAKENPSYKGLRPFFIINYFYVFLFILEILMLIFLISNILILWKSAKY